MEDQNQKKNKLTKIPGKKQLEITTLKKQISLLKSELALVKKRQSSWNEILEEGYFIHEKFVILDVNSALEKMSGYSKQELIGRHGKMLITEDSFERIQQMLVNDDSQPVELEMVRKNGERLFVYSRGKTVKIEGKTQRVVVIQNINELKRTQHLLEESKAKYKHLIQSSVLGIGISYEENLLFANRALLDMFGIKTFEEFTSRKLTDYMPPESKKLVKERLKKYKEKGPIGAVFRHELIRPDGSRRTLEITSNNLFYEGKNCRQVFAKDITDQLEQEAELLRASSIFKNILHGIIIYKLEDLKDDRTLKLISCNPAAERYLNMKSEDVVGKYIDEAFPAVRERGLPKYYADVVRKQEPTELDDVYYKDHRNVDGVFAVKAFPLPGNCVCISFENVTSRRQIEKDLQTRNEELNNLVYKVSHDLKAPLKSIQGLIYLSKMESNFEEHLPVIEGRINHLDQFIGDILSHARNLNIEVTYEPLDMKKIVEDCFEELQYLQDIAKVTREIHFEGKAFWSDKIRVTEICRNLVSNAFKYCDNTKDTPYVKVSIEIDSNWMVMSFEDNGMGIKQEYIERVLEMFYRATDKVEGSGIGLYIVKQALEKLNGTIDIESEYGVGSTFIVKIPNMYNHT